MKPYEFIGCFVSFFQTTGEKITATGLVGSIANGVLLCKLAQLIQDKAVECQRAGKSIGVSNPVKVQKVTEGHQRIL